MATQTAIPANSGVTLGNVEVINHLLFHKALIGEDEGNERINQYLSLIKEGEHVGLKDPFDRSIALVFDLVIQEQMNVWDVDLVHFSELYLKRAREENLDLVTAGRIIVMAWTILKLQSDDLVRKFERRQQETLDLDAGWDSLPDWGQITGDEFTVTERLLADRRPIDEKIWHEGDRPVTLMELVNAFEVARQEAEERIQLTADREKMRQYLRTEGLARFQGRVHKEDLEEDIRLIWDRIVALNGSAIPLTALYDKADIWDHVTAFNGVLFLNRDRRIQLWQEDFPYGPVLLRNLAATEGAPAAPPGKRQKEPPGEDAEPAVPLEAKKE